MLLLNSSVAMDGRQLNPILLIALFTMHCYHDSNSLDCDFDCFVEMVDLDNVCMCESWVQKDDISNNSRALSFAKLLLGPMSVELDDNQHRTN